MTDKAKDRIVEINTAIDNLEEKIYLICSDSYPDSSGFDTISALCKKRHFLKAELAIHKKATAEENKNKPNL